MPFMVATFWEYYHHSREKAVSCFGAVGIPRSLGYFYLFPLYRAFFDELGIPYVESPFTSKPTFRTLTCAQPTSRV